MTIAQNIRHRRAAAAVHRRNPAPEPQLGFDPTAIFGGGNDSPTRTTTTTDIFDGLTGILFPTNDDLPSVTSTSRTSSTSSSSSSSTISTTSTSTTSSTTSSSSQTTTTTTTPPPAQRTTVVTPTVVTSPTSLRASTSVSSTLIASATSTAEASTGLSTGAVVGGIGAGIVAIAALGFAVTFFIRRARKREDANAFDGHDFRRSAMILNDPPTHEDTVARGYNPRPPSMVERRLASPPPAFGNGYDNYNQEHYADNRAGYGATYQQPFTPGQVIHMDHSASSPMSPNSAHPTYPDAAYMQSPFSPIGTPVSEYGNYPEQPPLAHQPSAVGVYPVLRRQGSQGPHNGPDSPPHTAHTQFDRDNVPANDYVDLSRASVSPFQAAQYAEISRRLNTEVPAGMPTPDVEDEMPPALPPKYSSADASPFADPSSAPPSPGGQYPVEKRQQFRPMSAESETLEFPVPPSPAHTTSSRYRVDSMPPTLPEIQVESRVSVGQYAMRDSATPAALATGSKATAGPSPLAASYAPSPASPIAPAPPPAAATPSMAKAPQAPEPQLSNEQKRGTMYSMYDPEDAYGGF